MSFADNKKIKQPIFIVGFTRGGTALFNNMLLSHPHLCKPRGETHQIFFGYRGESSVTRWKKRMAMLPICLSQRENVFSHRLFRDRHPFTEKTRQRIDAILHQEKFLARGVNGNLYKAPEQYYTETEIEKARLVTKNMNGLIFLTPELLAMYPDATCIALVRNGYAICEGNRRRGTPLHVMAERYHLGVRRMIEDAERYPSYYLYRFEDFIGDPEKIARDIYMKCELNWDDLQYVRFVTKPSMQTNGQSAVPDALPNDTLVWRERSEFSNYFDAQVNASQLKQLKSNDIDMINDIAGNELEHFDYKAS